MRFNALSLSAALLLLISPTVSALFQDEAYQIDFHYDLLGAPTAENTFFHKPSASSRASLLYTLSEKLVLGAINPKDGSTVWRQDLADGAQNRSAVRGFLRTPNNTNLVISAAGNKVRGWDAAEGRMVWEREESGAVQSLSLLEIDPLVVSEQSGIVRISRLNAMNGKMIWEVTNRDDIPLAMTTSAAKIFYISLSSTLLKGYQIQVTEVEPNTAKPNSQYALSSENEVVSKESIVHVGPHSAAPVIAWTDKSFKTLKINLLGRKDITTISVAKHGEDLVQGISIHAPTSSYAMTHFLVHYRSKRANWAEVYHIDTKKGAISKAYDLPKLEGQGAISVHTIDADVFFIRHADSEITLVSSMSHGVLERWPVKQKSTNSSDFKQIVAAVSEVVAKGPESFAIRSAWTMESGDLDFILNGEHAWTRPESLSGVRCAAWINSPGRNQLANELEYESHRNVVAAYIHRVSRHVQDLKHFPKWVLTLPSRVLGGLGIEVVPSAKKHHQDSFGFQKMIIVATEKGRVLALDSGTGGSIIWSTKAVDLAPGTSWNVTDIHQDGAGILRITAPDLGRSAYVTLAGEILARSDETFNTGEGDQVVPVPLQSGQFELAFISKGVPNVPSIHELGSTGTLITQKPDGSLAGWRLQDQNLIQAWSFETSEGEDISKVATRPSHDPVASIGRPLGDRNVLYKFVSSNLLLVMTLNAKASLAKVYLLDSVSGQTLYATSHSAVDTTMGIEATFSENWFAYTLHLDPVLAGKEQASNIPRSAVLVVSELFESSISNDRGPLGSSSNVSSLTSTSYSPYVVSATYVMSSSLSHLSTTSTKQGITPRSILAYSSSLAALLSIPVALLSPRRPVGRDPSASEREEGLMRYSPLLEFHPQWTLSHKRELFGIKGIVSTPSDMESTSLVFAYGDVDVFGTRVSPIGTFDMLGKGFGKIQLVLTVLALAVGTGVLAPMARKKQIDTLWGSRGT